MACQSNKLRVAGLYINEDEPTFVRSLDPDGIIYWNITLPSNACPFKMFCCSVQDKLSVFLTDVNNDQLTVFDAASGELVHNVKPVGCSTQTLGTFGRGILFICYRHFQTLGLFSPTLKVSKELLRLDFTCIPEIRRSKKISNDQELIQSDPTSCPQTSNRLIISRLEHKAEYLECFEIST